MNKNFKKMMLVSVFSIFGGFSGLSAMEKTTFDSNTLEKTTFDRTTLETTDVDITVEKESSLSESLQTKIFAVEQQAFHAQEAQIAALINQAITEEKTKFSIHIEKLSQTHEEKYNQLSQEIEQKLLVIDQQGITIGELKDLEAMQQLVILELQQNVSVLSISLEDSAREKDQLRENWEKENLALLGKIKSLTEIIEESRTKIPLLAGLLVEKINTHRQDEISLIEKILGKVEKDQEAQIRKLSEELSVIGKAEAREFEILQNAQAEQTRVITENIVEQDTTLLVSSVTSASASSSPNKRRPSIGSGLFKKLMPGQH